MPSLPSFLLLTVDQSGIQLRAIDWVHTCVTLGKLSSLCLNGLISKMRVIQSGIHSVELM